MSSSHISARRSPAPNGWSSWICSVRANAPSMSWQRRRGRPWPTRPDISRCCALPGWWRPRRRVCLSATAWPTRPYVSSSGACGSSPKTGWPGWSSGSRSCPAIRRSWPIVEGHTVSWRFRPWRSSERGDSRLFDWRMAFRIGAPEAFPWPWAKRDLRDKPTRAGGRSMTGKGKALLALAAVASTAVALWLANRANTPKEHTWNDVVAEARKGGYRLLTTDELWERYHKGSRDLLLVDSRQEWEYRTGHIDGAVNFPMEPTWWSRWRRTSDLGSLLGPDKDRFL